MGFIEITIILVTLVIGGYLLYVASEHGKKQKAYYEHEALNSVNRALSKLQDDTKMYRVFLYRKWPFQEPTWDPSNVTALKELVVAGCTVHNPGGGGDVYTSSEFCISIDEDAKTIHFVIGESEFDFNNALQKNS
ncbi:MAG: hypothetical protein ACMZ63_06505 [Methylotenera sp.]|jgi:hypothetical protein